MVDHVISEIEFLDLFNKTVNGYELGGRNEDVVEIFSSPPRAVFNNAGDDEIMPIQDFLEVLLEWKNYLNSLPFTHVLSNK